jgi:hypothetical protein
VPGTSPDRSASVAPKGVHNIERLLVMAEDAALPESARRPITLLA